MNYVQNATLIFSLFALNTCGQPHRSAPEQTTVSGEEAILHAEQAARRIHLPGDLEAAGSNTKKILQVYLEAVELGDTHMQEEADKKLSSIIIPQAKSTTWEGAFRRLRKSAPEGSRTRKKLEEIHQKRLKEL